MPLPKPGERTPGSGRPPGKPNKVTADMRAIWTEAFERRGGVEALVAWSNTNPDSFYALASKLIPRDMNVAVGTSLEELVDRARRIKAEEPPPPPAPGA